MELNSIRYLYIVMIFDCLTLVCIQWVRESYYNIIQISIN